MIIKLNRWTSELVVFCNANYDKLYITGIIDNILSKLESKYSVFKEDSELSRYNRGESGFITSNLDYTFAREGGKLLKNCNIKEPLDFTGLLKGQALDLISEEFFKLQIYNYLINFGGDLICNNVKSSIRLNDFLTFRFPASSSYGLFTSGNYGSRGKHISTKRDHNLKTLTVFQEYPSSLRDLDMTATVGYSNGWEMMNPDSTMKFLDIDTGDKIVNRTYCASPFFNKEEIEIRDRMISRFTDIFRPDLTENSKNYSGSPGKELAQEILHENLKNIRECQYLVFPKGTRDLGTLFEVGYAYFLDKPVIRYDDSNGQYEIILSNKLYELVIDENTIVDCTKLSGAVVLGFHYGSNLRYYIGDLHDNIMLSESFTRVDHNGNVINSNYLEVL